MSTDLIRYDVLVQNALRSVVRKVLTDSVKDGLPGAHHFYISFDTGAPGVKISPRLKDMYPEEMTIVLQHQFWDLAVTETGFEVSLSFDKIPERLCVPYEAITGFFDPSVKFGLKFEAVTAKGEDAASEPAVAKPKKPSRVKPQPKGDEVPVQIGRKAKPEPAPEVAAEAPAAPAEEAGPQADAAKDGAAAEVISLDAFRKKK